MTTLQYGQWGNFDDDFCNELAEWIGGRCVLETFAGNGLLAKMLSARGVSIRATSLFAGHDGHERGMHFDVTEMDAARAVISGGNESDVLLMCWPTSTEAAFRASVMWGFEKPVVFIGEVTNLSAGELGGCASDNFFEVTDEVHVFERYKRRSYIDRASVRMVSDAKFHAWQVAARERFRKGELSVGNLMPLVLD